MSTKYTKNYTKNDTEKIRKKRGRKPKGGKVVNCIEKKKKKQFYQI